MSEHCRFCGKELVNGKCDCREFKAGFAFGEEKDSSKEVFFIPRYKLDFSSVSGFITSMRDQTGKETEGTQHRNPFERNTPIVPGCVDPEENEIVVKQYDIAKLRSRLKFMKAEGRLQVTNRRVLFRAAGKTPVGYILQQHQYALDELSGIEMHKDFKFSILSLIFAILIFYATSAASFGSLAISYSRQSAWMGFILGVAALSVSYVVYKRHWLKLFTSLIGYGGFLSAIVALYKLYQMKRDLAIGASGDPSPGTSLTTFPTVFGLIAFITLAGLLLLALITVIVNTIIVCYVPNLVIKIKTKGAAGAIVIGSQKSLFTRRTGDEYSGFKEVMPWKDTVMAMNELGPMIDDLQKHGDYAIEKWAK